MPTALPATSVFLAALLGIVLAMTYQALIPEGNLSVADTDKNTTVVILLLGGLLICVNLFFSVQA